MTWIAYIKRLKVSGMTWLLVGDDVNGLHIKMELVVGNSFLRDCKENRPKGHLVWILVFDDQHDHLDYYCLLAVLDIVQKMQSGLGLRQSGYLDDQHLKQDN